MPRHNPKVATPPLLYAALILVGYGAGYATHELAIPIPIDGDAHGQGGSINLKASPSSSLVCFTPNKGCKSLLLDQINKAQNSIYVQAYSFTDPEIARDLVIAYRRGIDVKVILDKSNVDDQRSAKHLLLYNRVPLRFDYPGGIAHNKVMVIDEGTVVTGSYNFSQSAYKRNTENLLILKDPSLAEKYRQNWYNRWEVSREPGSINSIKSEQEGKKCLKNQAG